MPSSQEEEEGPTTQADRIVSLFSWTFPSVCILAFVYVILNDSFFFAARIIGSRLPLIVRRAAMAANSIFNLLVATVGYLCIYNTCSPVNDVCSSNALIKVQCSKTIALSLCTVISLSISDRFFVVFLYPDNKSSFLSRMGEIGGVVIAWQLFAERQGLAPLFVALLLARRSRFALPRISKHTCVLLKCTVAVIAFNALGKNCNTISQKASVGILLSTFLLPSSFPHTQKQQPADHGDVTPSSSFVPKVKVHTQRKKAPISILTMVSNSKKSTKIKYDSFNAIKSHNL